MTSFRIGFVSIISVIALALAPLALAGSFIKEKYDNLVEQQLNIPVFFAFPESSFATLPQELPTSDLLIDFKHPSSKMAPHVLGYRIYSHKQDGTLASSLAESGFIQTGDIILSFRPEWGGGGPYPNIQMGVSHAGVAYIKNGVLYNIDMPLTTDYIGQLNSKHYMETKALHVIRPRGLTDQQKSNLVGWATKLVNEAGKIYPKYIAFNQDYTSPNYAHDKSLVFIKQLGQLAFGKTDNISLKMYCSEFAWSLLSLRDCDPDQPDAFMADGVPACIHPIFTPLPMVGSLIGAKSTGTGTAGLSDGPLLTISAMGLSEKERNLLLNSVFLTIQKSDSKMSPGHRKVAEQMRPVFGKLQGLYRGIFTGNAEALEIRKQFNAHMKNNYSPTSFIIQILLPKDHPARVMDYVGTVTYINQ